MSKSNSKRIESLENSWENLISLANQLEKQNNPVKVIIFWIRDFYSQKDLGYLISGQIENFRNGMLRSPKIISLPKATQNLLKQVDSEITTILKMNNEYLNLKLAMG